MPTLQTVTYDNYAYNFMQVDGTVVVVREDVKGKKEIVDMLKVPQIVMDLLDEKVLDVILKLLPPVRSF